MGCTHFLAVLMTSTWVVVTGILYASSCKGANMLIMLPASLSSSPSWSSSCLLTLHCFTSFHWEPGVMLESVPACIGQKTGKPGTVPWNYLKIWYDMFSDFSICYSAFILIIYCMHCSEKKKFPVLLFYVNSNCNRL